MPTVPITHPDTHRRLWFAEDVFTGPDGEGENVPNVGDGVVNLEVGFFKVDAVDSQTKLSTLTPKPFNNNGGGAVDVDTLLAAGPNMQSEAFRIHINPDVVPHTLAFDARQYLYSQDASYVKVFLGTDTTEDGHVISGMYNISNDLISENIPLNLIAQNGHGTNYAIKSPALGWAVEPLNDGQVVTTVVYSDQDVPLSYTRQVVILSNFIHSSDEDRKYIIAIELLSPFLSLSDNHLLEYPANVLLQSATLQGKLTFNDASTLTLPIDGARFQLLGMNRFIPMETGQRVELTLQYNLQPNEYGYGVSAPLPNRSLQEHYSLVTVAGLAEYNVKLFIIPKWNAGQLKWELDYYLYNLDRDILHYATPYVEYLTNSDQLDGSDLVGRQNITVAVNLASLDPGYLSYRYLQNFAIQFRAQATNNLANTYWILEYTEGVFYGSGLFATSVTDPANNTLRRLDVNLGLLDLDDWLDKVYYAIQPLRTPTELAPPMPTHVRVRIGNSWMREIGINDILNHIDGITAATPPTTVVRLEFIRREDVDLELGVASMNIRT